MTNEQYSAGIYFRISIQLGRKSISPPFPHCPAAISDGANASGLWPTSKANLIYKWILNYTFLVSHNDSPILPVEIKNQHVLLSPRRDTFRDAFEMPWTFVCLWHNSIGCAAVGGRIWNYIFTFIHPYFVGGLNEWYALFSIKLQIMKLRLVFCTGRFSFLFNKR